jgi:hypothetical protein
VISIKSCNRWIGDDGRIIATRSGCQTLQVEAAAIAPVDFEVVGFAVCIAVQLETKTVTDQRAAGGNTATSGHAAGW